MSIVVPVRNEREVLPLFWARLRHVRHTLRASCCLHVLFVDDASFDGSGQWLDGLARKQSDVSVIHAPSALGQQRALMMGLERAWGDAVVTLDADLQDPPEIIERMVVLWRQGFDVVYGVRAARLGESVCKRLSAATFYRLLSLLSRHAIPTDSGDFRLVDRRVIEVMRSMHLRRPYVRGMVACAGFKQVPCVYTRAARGAGSSSYDLFAMWHLAWAGVVGFAQPWRVAVSVALASAFVVLPEHLFGHQSFWVLMTMCTATGIVCGAALAWLQRLQAPLTLSPGAPGAQADSYRSHLSRLMLSAICLPRRVLHVFSASMPQR